MSMPDGRLSCTACDYRGFMAFRRITLAYHFADGTTVNGHHEMRWCNDCRNPRDAEGAQPAIEPLQTELDALARQVDVGPGGFACAADLTNEASINTAPSYSPDGMQIAFESEVRVDPRGHFGDPNRGFVLRA